MPIKSVDEEASVQESSSSDDDDEEPPMKKKKTVTPSNRSPSKSPAFVKRRPSIQTKKSPKKPQPRKSNAAISTRSAFTKARITQALKTLSKAVLNNHHGGGDDINDSTNLVDETPQNSLVAALLSSAKPVSGITSTARPKSFYQHEPEEALYSRDKRTRVIVDICLPQLDGIVRDLVRTTDHEGPHELHVKLINLLFRSVGGSTKTNIAPETDLDELEDEDWDDMISKVVTVMKNESDADQMLLAADDEWDDDDDHDGTLTTRQIGIIVYRALYKEFWYRLGHVLLAHSPSPAVAMVSEEDDDSDDSNSEKDSDDDSDDSDAPISKMKQNKKKSKAKKKKPGNAQGSTQAFSSNRFQLEKVRDLILRMTELVSVGQPDLRAAATLAVLQLSKSCVERTVELEQKIRVASRQLKVASKAGSKQKQQTLQHHLDNWKRHKAELEEIVEGPVFQGVFIHRYRDTHDRIRRDCLRSLSQISLIRPDLFLVDMYLKYFGWMASDKADSVRVASLEGLLAPFRAAGWTVASISSNPFPIVIDNMHNVAMKFLNRIVDCIDDKTSIRAQELAIKVLLSMLREEFLDDWDDDTGWDKVNLKSIDVLSSSKVRKDALYFVMDQLDAFDTDGKEAGQISEKKQSEQLVGIARWCANKLLDGQLPLSKMHIELVDCLVESILGMPEHKALMLNWSMILKAIRSEGAPTEREETATQRILLRMLATSAKLEMEKASDQDNKPMKQSAVVKRKRSSNAMEAGVEELSTALLKNLPHLLETFKGDVMSLRDVTKLPSTIASSILGLPSRKTDFQTLVKTLCQLYLDSTDQQILENIAQTLSQWVEGDHTRVSEVKINLKRLSVALQERLMKLFEESDPSSGTSVKSKASSKKKSRGKRNSRSPAKKSRKDDNSTIGTSTMFSSSPEADAEHSISLLMLRWEILLRQCDAKYLFSKGDEEDDEDEIEGLFLTISEAMGKRLSDRMPILDQGEGDDASTAFTMPTIWKDDDPEVHEAVSSTVQRSLRVLLLIVSHELMDTLLDRADFETTKNKTNDDDLEVDEYNFPVLKLRDNLIKLLGLCFDQHLPALDGVEYTDEQHEFANAVQTAAGQVSSDLRTLFPYDWSEASDPVKRGLALTNSEDFTILLSGSARWFQTQEESDVVDEEGADGEKKLVNEALLPLARVTTMNFGGFFRKEAAMILSHISGSGGLAAQTMLALSRTLKKTNPVRLLESQMACLRLAFEHWLDTEPIVPEETQPTEEEMQSFDEAEKRHLDAFASMEQVSSKLSSTLGVAGRLANDSLKKSIFGFVREGIRYSFDGAENQEEDDLVVGSRLAFLLILSK